MGCERDMLSIAHRGFHCTIASILLLGVTCDVNFRLNSIIIKVTLGRSRAEKAWFAESMTAKYTYSPCDVQGLVGGMRTIIESAIQRQTQMRLCRHGSIKNISSSNSHRSGEATCWSIRTDTQSHLFRCFVVGLHRHTAKRAAFLWNSQLFFFSTRGMSMEVYLALWQKRGGQQQISLW